MHHGLRDAGFTQDQPSTEGIARRYRRNGAVIDVLASDNIGARARLRLGRGRTLSAPGTTQAFRRSQLMTITLADGPTAEINAAGERVGSERRPAMCSAQRGRSGPLGH